MLKYAKDILSVTLTRLAAAVGPRHPPGRQRVVQRRLAALQNENKNVDGKDVTGFPSRGKQ